MDEEPQQKGNSSNGESRVAVFVDIESIDKQCRLARIGYQVNSGNYIADLKAISDYASRLGAVTAMKAYVPEDCYWYTAKAARKFGLQAIPCEVKTFSDSPRKSLVKCRMSVEILSTAYEEDDIQTFLLVSGRKDFQPAIEKLLNLGKTVKLLSLPEHTARDILSLLETETARDSASEFVDYGKVLSMMEN